MPWRFYDWVADQVWPLRLLLLPVLLIELLLVMTRPLRRTRRAPCGALTG